MGEHGMSYHVKGTNPKALAKLLRQLTKPSVILDIENQQYLPFVTRAELETLKKLIPFPLLHYIYDDDHGIWIYGYFQGQEIFSIIMNWAREASHIPQPRVPNTKFKEFKRPQDKKLIETGFFDSPEDISKLVEIVEGFTYFDDGSTEEDWKRKDFDWSAWGKAHYAHQYVIPITLGLTEFFNVDCSPVWSYPMNDFLDYQMYPNHLLVSVQPDR